MSDESLRLLNSLAKEMLLLRQEISELKKVHPKGGPKWVSTADLASELGVTARTVGKWIAANRFDDTVIRRKRRGNGVIYKLDRDKALEQAELIMTS